MKIHIKTLIMAALLSSSLIASAGLTTSTYSVSPDVWAGTPSLYTTLAPNSNQTVSQGGGTNSAVALTFTTGASGFQLDSFSIVAAGGPSTGIIHLYQSPVGGTEADGYVNLSFSTDLLGGGAGLGFTYFGSATQNILNFDLTGSDQVTLLANTLYAIDFTANVSDTAYNFYVRRGGAFYTAGGNIYATATADTAAGQRFDVSGSGRRDAPLALYAVPEPASMTLMGLGTLAGLMFIRRRKV